MVMQEQMHQLDMLVSELLGRHEFAMFSRYWSLYKRTVASPGIDASYLVFDQDTKWCNVAIIDGSKIIDIEGEDSADVGIMSVRDVSCLSSVIFKLGPLVGLSRSQGASLVVATELVGPTSGPFWVARTPDEEEKLLGFAGFLAGLIPYPRVSGV